MIPLSHRSHLRVSKPALSDVCSLPHPFKQKVPLVVMVETELVWCVVAETELEDQLLSGRVSARPVRAAGGDPSGHQQFAQRQRLRVRLPVCAECEWGRVHEDVRDPILQLQSSGVLRSSGDARMARHFAGAGSPVRGCQEHRFPGASGSCLPRHRDLCNDHLLHGFQQKHLGQ